MRSMNASAGGLLLPPSWSYHSSNSYWEQKLVEDFLRFRWSSSKISLCSESVGFNRSHSSRIRTTGLAYLAMENITKQELNEDAEEGILYVGKYPEETVDLLAVCEPFNVKFGEEIEKGSEEAFKIQNKLYAEGVKLISCYSEVRSAEFNLKGKYSELSFSVGYIDETELENKFYLRIYVDDYKNPCKTFEFDSHTDVEKIYTIPLNHGENMKLEWICDRAEYAAFSYYGLINLKLK